MFLRKKCANCSNCSFLEELVLVGSTTNCTTDKPIELIILLAKLYVYKCKMQGSMPVFSVFQTIFRSRYNIENYARFMLGKKIDLKMQGLSHESLV